MPKLGASAGAKKEIKNEDDELFRTTKVGKLSVYAYVMKQFRENPKLKQVPSIVRSGTMIAGYSLE
eukprot:12425972-Karenia_brevis.AAC.1